MRAVGQHRQGVARDAPQQPVGEHDAQPRADPVGGHQQEVAERRGVVHHRQRDGEADQPDDHGDRGAGERRGEPHAHGGERQRAGVEVDRVRRQGTDEDRDQGQVAEPARHQRGVGGGGVVVVPARDADGGDGGGTGDLQHRGRGEIAQCREHTGAAGLVGTQVAGVVGGVDHPAAGVAERRADDDPEGARNGLVGGAGIGLEQDEDRAGREDDGQHGEGDPLDHLHHVVAEERDHQSDRHGDDQRQVRVPARQCRERERPADAVHREPADTAEDRVAPGREQVAPEAEGLAVQCHLTETRLPGVGPR
ncbi:hypothetical protein RM445_11555 [Pseudonocardia sp. DSM 45834]|uniref:Uncharacterized protein n=1 Tax=Pseudonocardia charpentierae TaxID=3075545 RepID=A0ABU2NA55_9PSEU|nr:hypothetical protein [Pseudonocardia sp. DSM 45834]MDT0350159.1 hypothetical protein [Pseudonocardia sp. DSM 45834]